MSSMHTTVLYNGPINNYRLITQQFEHNSLQENNTCTQIGIAMKALMGDWPQHTFNIEK